jgi:hypothetical protein
MTAEGTSVHELSERIAQLTAGADPTPVPEAVMMTPGQLLHRLNEASGIERLEMAERILDSMGEASACFLQDHQRRLVELEEVVRVGCWLVAEARWVAESRRTSALTVVDELERLADEVPSA